MRLKNRQYLICLLFMFTSCTYTTTHKRHLTEHLFMERSRIGITHPQARPGNTGDRILSEKVSYHTPPPAEPESDSAQEARLDTNKVYTLQQVTVTSRARFAPVRQGEITIDFIVHVPQAFLSDDYQVILTPELIHADSVVKLQDVVLRGKNFADMQQQDYDRYQSYLDGIIAPTAYDSAFVDHQGVNRELERRRKNRLDSYYAQWSLMQQYRDWRNQQQAKYDVYNVKQSEILRRKLTAHQMKYQTAFARKLAVNGDTAELGRKYRAERKKMMDASPVRRVITLDAVPARFREFYLKGINPEDLAPVLPGDQDSLLIAEGFLLHEKIAVNEAKGSRQQEVFKYMVPSPYRPDAHYNAPITPGRDYSYRYTCSYPVTPGLKNLKVTLGGCITATDRSYYKIQPVDTLGYIISTMDELANGQLIGNPAFTGEQRAQYTLALKLLRDREYARALNILTEYNDYNTAVALTCMGYDARAYQLLGTLEQNADTHYLAAILCVRMKELQAAADHLNEACRMDPSKADRAQRDPEMGKLKIEN